MDYLNRKELLDKLEAKRKEVVAMYGHEPILDGFEFAYSIVESMPVVDAEPVKHGEWKDTTRWVAGFGYCYTKCSVCNAEFQGALGTGKAVYNFCPTCGADMRKEG